LTAGHAVGLLPGSAPPTEHPPPVPIFVGAIAIFLGSVAVFFAAIAIFLGTIAIFFSAL
jgi:hypothetical protein